MTARASFGERSRQVVLALGWIALFVAIGGAASFGILRLVPVTEASPWYLAVNSAGLALGFFLATWLVGVRLAKDSWDHWGWHTQGGLVGRIVRGAGLGILMAALAIGLSFVANHATVRVRAEWVQYAAAAGPLAVMFLAAALFEELVFRGFPLRRLADAVGPWAAMLLCAAGFGIAHVENPHAGFFGLVNVALAAVWLAFAFFSHGGMGLAWGLHFGWNAGLALLFDAPVSGNQFTVPAVDYQPGRLSWVDGGSFGPEGGVVATVVLVAGTLAVIGARFKQPRNWLL